MRLASSGGNSPVSRNESTCRSGSTSRWVSACGLMSRIATNPSPALTWSPSRTSRQKRQSSRSEHALLGDRRAADADELAHRRVHEPRRVVVAVAAAGTVDEHAVIGTDLLTPAREAGLVGHRPQARAALALHGRRDGVTRRRLGAGPRRVREDVHFGDPRVAHHVERSPEGGVVLGGEAGEPAAGKRTIGWVVRLKSASGSSRRRKVWTL